MRFIILFTLLTFSIVTKSNGQCYWQQRVDYKMDIDFDTKNHQFKGEQKLVYTNNSPDTLKKVYYHLYYNAFQPNSMMYQKILTVPDADTRFPLIAEMDKLTEDEIGYQKVKSLKQNGEKLEYEISYTTLEVKLNEPLLPGESTTFEMKFEAQVPLQIRRTGRNSFDGVDYSMAQWFPKMAEYDISGWHADPYVGREFYAPWGDYEVNITIGSEYVLAGTGIVQNPNEVGYGYEEEEDINVERPKKLTWHFKAENVHDFVWAADPEYVQTKIQTPNGGPLIRIFYVDNGETTLWKTELPTYAARTFEIASEKFGQYGWSQYSIIHGGDGGMEYPMATLIINKKRVTGIRSKSSLVGTMVHEVMHSWYQGMLATDESHFAWMDEGFATYAEDIVLNELNETGLEFPSNISNNSYIRWIETGKEEAACTHSDHFKTRNGYSKGSYTKGGVALSQLSYIMGHEKFMTAMLDYRNQWGFKHPYPNDFFRIMEKNSDLELHWFLDEWIYTTNTIDYGIESVEENKRKTKVTLSKTGLIPMPLDITVTKKDGSKELYYIPIGLMRGVKENETDLERVILEDWLWTHPDYTFDIKTPLSDIESIEIDESLRMADVNRKDNKYTGEQVKAEPGL